MSKKVTISQNPIEDLCTVCNHLDAALMVLEPIVRRAEQDNMPDVTKYLLECGNRIDVIAQAMHDSLMSLVASEPKH